jgi:hypothetical protein
MLWHGHIVVTRCKAGLRDMPSYCSISSTKWELTFAARAGTTTQMVPASDADHIVAIYAVFGEVFRNQAETLTPRQSIDHAIDSEPGYDLPYWRITIERN